MKVKTLFETIIRARKNVVKRNKAFICQDDEKAAEPPDKGSWKTWRNLSLRFAIPMVILGTVVNIILVAMCGETRGAPFVPYEYMYRRVRRFPWGDGEKTLFHNPEVNPLPDGYEPGYGPTQRYTEDMDEQDTQEEPLLETGPPLEKKPKTEDQTAKEEGKECEC